MPSQIQKRPKRGANAIINNAPPELLTPFGSSVITPNKESFKCLAAKMLKEPPLCSYIPQKIIEKRINTRAAINFFRSSAVTLDIS
ncbi:hypothetical protein D3C81_1549360 [compost metagenome]